MKVGLGIGGIGMGVFSFAATLYLRSERKKRLMLNALHRKSKGQSYYSSHNGMSVSEILTRLRQL